MITSGRNPEHQWFYDAMQADPVSTGLALQATAGDIFADYTVWANKTPAQTQERFGPVAAYYLTHMSEGTLDRLTADHPITHEVRFVQPPEGLAPAPVRESVVGARVYARTSLGSEAVVNVHPLDLQLGLLNQGRVEPASWYRNYMNDRLREGQAVTVWEFDPHDVEASPREYDGGYHGYSTSPYLPSLFGTINTLHIVAPFDSLQSVNLSLVELQRQREARIQALEAYFALGEYDKNWAGIQFVTDTFARASEVRDNYFNDPNSSRVSAEYDTSTGELLRFVANGTVLFDRVEGIDLSDETNNYAAMRQSPEELARQHAERERLRAIRPDPQDLTFTDEEYDWHLNRIANGL